MKIVKKAPETKGTIEAMNMIFSGHGVPEVCQSDNGQPFRAKEIKMFTQKMEVMQSMLHLWANGMVERFNRSMKEAIQAGTRVYSILTSNAT